MARRAARGVLWAPPGGPTAGGFKPAGPPAAHAVGPPPPPAQYGRSSEAPAAPRTLGEPRPLPAMQRQPTPGAVPDGMLRVLFCIQ